MTTAKECVVTTKNMSLLFLVPMPILKKEERGGKGTLPGTKLNLWQTMGSKL